MWIDSYMCVVIEVFVVGKMVVGLDNVESVFWC